MPSVPPLPRRAWQALFWAQVLAVTALMLWPRPPPAIDTGWDKLNHVLAFAGPAFAGLAALHRHLPGAVARLMLALLAWGGALEAAQALLPPRTPSLADLAANAVGITLGALAWAFVARWRKAPAV